MRGNRRVLSATALGVLVLVLLAGAYNGLREGVSAISYADTPGMRVATVTQLCYGVCSLAALLGLALKRPWTFGAVLAASLAATLTAGIAPVVYGGQPVKTGILSGVAAALVLALIVWAWRWSSRRPPKLQPPIPNP